MIRQKISARNNFLKLAIVFLFVVNAITLGFFTRRHLFFKREVYLQDTVTLNQRKATEYQKTDNILIKYSQDSLPDCSNANNLVGRMKIDYVESEKAYMKKANESLDDVRSKKDLGTFSLAKDFTSVLFEPGYCRPIRTVAIIIPFRDRERHLRILLGHLIPVLERQLVRFSIFVIAQIGENIFNKGRLLNAGFEYAMESGKRNEHPFDCFIFHDVDLLVEDDKLQYRCTEGGTTRHLSVAINLNDYKWLAYGITVGGVLAMTEDQFKKVNGYSNMYWGWGGEDDDMLTRIRNRSFGVERPEHSLAKYTMILHDGDKNNVKNNKRHELLKTANKRVDSDGLSSLGTKIFSVERFALFVKVNVDVG